MQSVNDTPHRPTAEQRAFRRERTRRLLETAVARKVRPVIANSLGWGGAVADGTCAVCDIAVEALLGPCIIDGPSGRPICERCAPELDGELVAVFRLVVAGYAFYDDVTEEVAQGARLGLFPVDPGAEEGR
jgi:hypothetical protein